MKHSGSSPVYYLLKIFVVIQFMWFNLFQFLDFIFFKLWAILYQEHQLICGILDVFMEHLFTKDVSG